MIALIIIISIVILFILFACFNLVDYWEEFDSEYIFVYILIIMILYSGFFIKLMYNDYTKYQNTQEYSGTITNIYIIDKNDNKGLITIKDSKSKKLVELKIERSFSFFSPESDNIEDLSENDSVHYRCLNSKNKKCVVYVN